MTKKRAQPFMCKLVLRRKQMFWISPIANFQLLVVNILSLDHHFLCSVLLIPFSTVSLSLLGGWLSVYAAICGAPYWGPTFYCVDRCRYSLPFWSAAAGERSVPLSQPGVISTLCGGSEEEGSITLSLLVYLIIIAPPALSLGVLLGSLPGLA